MPKFSHPGAKFQVALPRYTRLDGSGPLSQPERYSVGSPLLRDVPSRRCCGPPVPSRARWPRPRADLNPGRVPAVPQAAGPHGDRYNSLWLVGVSPRDPAFTVPPHPSPQPLQPPARRLPLRACLRTCRPWAGQIWIFLGGMRRVADVRQEAPGNRMGVESSAMPGALGAVLPCR
jgi:hypothetical protein